MDQAEHLSGTLYRTPEFSLCATLSSLLLCPENLLPSSSWIFRSIVSTQRVHQALHRLPLPGLWPGTSLKSIGWGNQRANFLCFLFLNGRCPSWPDIQCVANSYFVYFSVFLLVLVRRVNLAPYFILARRQSPII